MVPAPQVINHETVTRQIHRADTGPADWWDGLAVLDLPGALHAPDLAELKGLFGEIRDMGFDAVLLRLATQKSKDLQESVARAVDDAHEAGLRLLVRIGPDQFVVDPGDTPPFLGLEENRETLLTRTRALVSAGADGVDLGMIDDAAHLPDRADRAQTFSETINLQLAELAETERTVILSGEAATADPEFFAHHLSEDWFHHLRDDSLIEAPWDVKEIRERVTRSYAMRDALGRTAVWRPALAPKRKDSARQRVAGAGSWSEHGSRRRASALMMFAGSLPGALYLPFAHVGGRIKVKNSKHPRVFLKLGSGARAGHQRDLATRMLDLREQRNIPSSTLAFVENLSWAPPGVSVHLSGSMLVVLNASESPVVVPAHHVPLLYSDGFVRSTEAGTSLLPETCAWFETARPRISDPGHPWGGAD